MTTKDYVYLGLILLTALAFYCNGFYAGVYRCKRVYDTLLEEAEADSDDTASEPKPEKTVATHDNPLIASFPSREHGILLPGRDVWGDFRNN
jgi:hypothetical protein